MFMLLACQKNLISLRKLRSHYSLNLYHNSILSVNYIQFSIYPATSCLYFLDAMAFFQTTCCI